jgi:hypothetical protein
MGNLLKTTEFASCQHPDIDNPLNEDGAEKIRHVP